MTYILPLKSNEILKTKAEKVYGVFFKHVVVTNKEVLNAFTPNIEATGVNI